MKLSKFLIKTERNAPADAEIISHKLLVRAGMIYKVASGIYSYLPLALRVIKKIEDTVRKEMDAEGAQEILMSALQPAELWQRTGRWQKYGPELMRLKDRNNRDFCLGPTHEELVTTIVASNVKSYKQLPVNVYQIQVKFRDEIRPRFGLMRVREFHMKDGYSFDKDDESMIKTYNKMYEAYGRTFSAFDLPWRVVESESGLIGGKVSHEFMVLTETGEEGIAYCEGCDYSANIEVAKVARFPYSEEEMSPIQKVKTEGVTKVGDVAKYLNSSPGKLVKTLILKTSKGNIGVLLRGDRELNISKLMRILDEQPEFIKSEDFPSGIPFGYSGPVNIGIPLLADLDVKRMRNFITGANEKDHHLINVNLERDFTVDKFEDLVQVKEGDLCPECESTLKIARGIEVGNIFQLGRKYSVPLDATFTDEDGQKKPFVMGCYGIGIGRVMAAIIEIHNDKDGIKWPLSVAPFQVIVLPVKTDDPQIFSIAEKVYSSLKEKYEVLIDDRNESPGVKFSDADLIGVPIQVIIGKKATEGKVEIKIRKTDERRVIPVEDLTKEIDGIMEWLK